MLHKDLKGYTFGRLYPLIKINLNYQAVNVSIGGLWAVPHNVDHSIMASCSVVTSRQFMLVSLKAYHLLLHFVAGR